jgi:hypothetical protein
MVDPHLSEDELEQQAVDSANGSFNQGDVSPEERRERDHDLEVQQDEHEIPRPSQDGDADNDLDEPVMHHHDTR